MRAPSRARLHATLLVATGLLASSALSQRAMAQDASPYVPLQHWTMPYVEHLIARGADRKSTRLNSSHLVISYAVFCLKKKKGLLRLFGDTTPRQQPGTVTMLGYNAA